MYYKVTLTAEIKCRCIVFAFSKSEARQLAKSIFSDVFKHQKIRSVYVSELKIDFLVWQEADFNDESIIRRLIIEEPMR